MYVCGAWGVHDVPRRDLGGHGLDARRICLGAERALITPAHTV